MDILKSVTTRLNKLFEDGYTVPFQPTLRPSRQPFCPRWMYFDKQARTEHKEWPGDLILTCGAATHQVMQRWCPLKIETYGRWHCHNCDYRPISPRWHKGPCPQCGHLIDYVELELHCKDLNYWRWDEKTQEWVYEIYTGHCDGIWRIYDKIILVDYKTIRWVNVGRLKGTAHFKYQMQTTIYARCLKETYGIDIDYILIFYLNRDTNLGSFDWEPMLVVPDFANYEKYVEACKYYLQCADQGQLPQWGVCYDQEHTHYCPWVEKCFDQSKGKAPAGRNPEMAKALTGEEKLVSLSSVLGHWKDNEW